MSKKSTLFTLILILLASTYAGAVETKDIRYLFKKADPVVFSHAYHLARYNNNCRICHDAIFSLKNRRHYTMAEMEKTKSCGACHSGVKAFSVASEKDCVRCHKGKLQDIPYKIKGVGEAVFSHSAHVTKAGLGCRECHNGKIITGKEKRVTMAEMEKGRTCGACHKGKTIFTVAGNCDRCHKGLKPKDIEFKIKGIAPAIFSHSFHTQAYTCKDCHTKTFPYRTVVGKVSMDDMAKGKSCGVCHNGKEAFSSNGDCARCHKGWKPGKITYKTSGGEAVFSHELHIQSYKCVDCHTKIFPYKAGVLKASMADMEAGKSCGACHNKGKDAFSVQDDCGKCHKM